MLPYAVPFFGHVFSLALNPVRALSQLNVHGQKLSSHAVYGLKVLGRNVYFVHGPDHVARLRKYPATITTPGVTTFVLKALFGMAPEAVNVYNLDSSGIHVKPAPGTQIAPHNRIDHLAHANFHKHLLGEGLSKIYEGFLVSLTYRFSLLNITDEWNGFPDLVSFWLPPMTSAMNEALAGPMLECISPGFTENLLKYYPYLHSLMKGVPSWLIPEASRLRQGLIRDVAAWHSIARARFQESDVDPATGRDPWWGSAFMRERQVILRQVDRWDANAIASSDFGIFWGSSVNIHPMAIWSILEVFNDKELLCRVRSELSKVRFQGIINDEETEKLLAIPLLQSIYSELLRLRVEVQTMFCSDKEDIFVNDWRIPKGSLIVVPAGKAHMDNHFWNTRSGQYPLEQFWADRLLAYSGDPQSDPRKHTHPNHKSTDSGEDNISRGKSRFVTSGLADSFMPYGIGERTCPGRGFARREIITFCALIVDRYDIEFPLERLDLRTTTAFYGIGTQRLKGVVPFKIRQRVKSE